MRKLFFIALIVTSGTALFAQNLDKVQELISKKNYAAAKDLIDKAVADPKGQKNATAWYYKGLIYNELAKDSTQDLSAYRADAYNALKTSQDLDPKNIMGELEQNWRLFDIYNYYLNTAIKKHNTKDYAAALTNYKAAIDVQQYISNKKFSYNNQTLPALDTTVTLYAGNAAYLAKDTAAGVQFFSQIADAKVGGKDYEYSYQALVDYYSKKGDQANAEKYAALGKQLYPESDYWTYYELDDPALRGDKTKMLAKYEDIMARNPQNSELALSYASEYFNYVYSNENKPSNYADAQSKLEQAITKAITLDKSGTANFLMTQHIYNQIYDLQEAQRAVKGTKPEDIKKKNGIIADINKKYESFTKYGDAAVQQYSDKTNMKTVEKANYKNLLTQLSNYYKSKKQLDKAKVYDDKMKSLG